MTTSHFNGAFIVHLFEDGDQWCATFPDFINLQESLCGFGDKPGDAVAELFKAWETVMTDPPLTEEIHPLDRELFEEEPKTTLDPDM